MKYIVTLNGKNYEVEVDQTTAAVTGVTAAPAAAPAPAAAAPAPAPAPAPAAAAPAPAPAPVSGGTQVTSPMPGTVLNINVTVGQAVKSGDTLLVLEAMKMENDIPAPVDGTVAQIIAAKGAAVNTGDVLIVLK